MIKKAPTFSLPNQDGKTVSLMDFKGKWLVLYFYPRDNTPGCTIEAIDFTKQLSGFKKLNAEVVGISADSPESHCKFIEKKNLKITLLSDPEKEMIKKYKVWRPKKFLGREFLGIVRTTILIDPKGNIVHTWDKVRVKGHVDEVLKTLQEHV